MLITSFWKNIGAREQIKYINILDFSIDIKYELFEIQQKKFSKFSEHIKLVSAKENVRLQNPSEIN